MIEPWTRVVPTLSEAGLVTDVPCIHLQPCTGVQWVTFTDWYFHQHYCNILGPHWLLLWMATPCGGLRDLRSQRQMEWYWCFCEYKRIHQRSADWIPKFSYWKLSILPLQHPWDKHHDYHRTVPSLTLWPCASVCTLFLKWFLSQEVLHASLEQRLGKSNASVRQIGIAFSSEALGFYSKLTLDSASSESISCISYRSPGLQYAIHGIYCKIRETSIFWCVTSVFSETLFDH